MFSCSLASWLVATDSSQGLLDVFGHLDNIVDKYRTLKDEIKQARMHAAAAAAAAAALLAVPPALVACCMRQSVEPVP